ncbi:MAG TPA: endo alpha-1,4 polygalactosaminidase [Actinocrinis sp.]|nr:endo alpha-1,4 polygalactosaminidase [Actinocrinis sp.]
MALLAASTAACSPHPNLSRTSNTIAPAPTQPTQSMPLSPAPTPAPQTSGRPIWQPRPGLTWQWQLTEPVDTSVDAQVYDIDGTENDAAVVAALHAAGRKVICYVNVGAFESFRPDARLFPPAVVGAPNGWPGERWLDVRQLTVLRPIIAARFKTCAAKGFDGIEADNVDGYENDTGFPLTNDDQLAFNRMVAGLAHADGLAIGLKNDLDQVPQLVSSFDFAVNEQCAEYTECDELEPFIAEGKAVFHVEYTLPLSDFCAQTTALGLSSMRKDMTLDATRWPCPAHSA